MSGKPNEIKNKILPVLRIKLPKIESSYTKNENDVLSINDDIRRIVNGWFQEKAQIDGINEELKNLGTLNAVMSEKEETENEIEGIKDKFQLNEKEVNKIQKLSEELTEIEGRISQVEKELEAFDSDGANSGYLFQKCELSFSPALNDLSDKFKQILNQKIEELSQYALIEINKAAAQYYRDLKKELSDKNEEKAKRSKELDAIKEKQEQNNNLDSLIQKSSDLKAKISEIKQTQQRLVDSESRITLFQEQLCSLLSQRKSRINSFVSEIEEVDQSVFQDMKFGVEADIDPDDIQRLKQCINSRNNTDFIVSGNLDIEKIRSNSADFLNAIFSGHQRLNSGNDKQEVGTELLTLTEKILFTAEMEGDRIGGFKASTMTPGKRALFALRLLLAESEDTWPLLIDQPEDDLDSRSIYDDIVPFLREKKKERQIIMVSHNANLVVGADSEQIIVANRNGDDRQNEDGKQFNYIGGSIENKKDYDTKCKDTLKSQGIREHACQILEGGEIAFEKRSNRYDFSHRK